jgi:hypothetical protein
LLRERLYDVVPAFARLLAMTSRLKIEASIPDAAVWSERYSMDRSSSSYREVSLVFPE